MIRKCLAIGIILLFIGTCIIPAIAQDTEKPLPTSRGNWLYVGGGGPGNYTRIQDAIDNASDGDTVFVYDDSSPYYEHLTINCPITLKGENRTTTVVDGNNTGYLIDIKVDSVIICGFTLQNGKTGIYSTTNRNHIFDNTIVNQYTSGIYFHANHIKRIGATNNRIENNIISHNQDGIHFFIFEDVVIGSGSLNSIKNNVLTENGLGIVMSSRCSGNLIYGNIIKSNQDEGIDLDLLINGFNRIVKNHIEQNGIGIRVAGPSVNIIRNNNIINNTIDALFVTIITRLYSFWIGNYWNRPHLGPKVIFGVRVIPNFSPESEPTILPCFSFDIRPALKPYDIGV
jgi:parallel beta-helix repeat protein